MAAPVDTNCEGDGESQLDSWLKQNRLIEIRDKFKRMQVMYEDLIELSSSSNDDLKAYARDELGLNLMTASRFAKAVSGLKPKKKKERIVLSAEEGDAIENIDKRQKEIRARVTKATNNIDTLMQWAKTNEEEVNTTRKEAIGALNKRFDDLISKSNAETHKKEESINKHVEELKAYDKALSRANAECDHLLEEGAMDKSKRKTTIVAISEKILETEIQNINVTAKVGIEMNKNEILRYIGAIGNVNNYVYPQAPRIAVHNIEATSATVRFSDIEASYECAVELCENYGDNGDDEKENDIVWKQMCLVKDQKEHKMTHLKDDMTHGVRARYKNEHGFGEWCHAVAFKTKLIPITIQSSILSETEVSVLASLLQQSGKEGLSKKWNLLYRGSRDGFQASAFHNKCDGKSKTLSVICSDTNNVFGGYASVPWKGGGGSYAADNDAFIFLIRSSKNYPPQVFTTQKQENKQCAVLHDSSFMCTFGGGCDIVVNDNCNANTHSYVNGNHTYMNLPTTYYLNGETKYFKVREIEVFISQ